MAARHATPASSGDGEVQTLAETLVWEILNAAGLPSRAALEALVRLVLGKATMGLARIGVTFERLAASEGFPSACAWALTNWCSRVRGRGTELVAREGPLLVVSNHAGAYDSLAIASLLERRDLRIIASDISFLKHLPQARSSFIFVTQKVNERMLGLRAAVRHLSAGGAVLLFGTGLVDPDPEVYDGAELELENWSGSIDAILRRVPGCLVSASIVSGILSRRWARHPLTMLRSVGWQRRRLAEFGQVIEQLVRPGRHLVAPNVSFSPSVPAAQLREEGGTGRWAPAVIARGRALLDEHMAWVRGSFADSTLAGPDSVIAVGH